MVSCIGDINRWMTSNLLKLNTDKTDFILLGTRQQLGKTSLKEIDISGVRVPVSTTVMCLGVLIDSELMFAAHIRRLTGRCFHQFRQLLSIRRTLKTEAGKTLVHALVITRVDYCNSIIGSTSAVHLRSLQSVLNAAARLIVKRRKYDHITDSLRDELHWLPIHYRRYYKLCILIYKCLHCSAPSYLVDQCVPISMNSARSGLRSATNRNLAYPRTNLVRYGQRGFSVIGPRTLNELPADLRDPDKSLDAFWKKT